eukprot:PhM_4_TR1890/c0_g1_i3/m.38021
MYRLNNNDDERRGHVQRRVECQRVAARNGLCRTDTVVRDASGKVVPELTPTAGTQHDVFVPHVNNHVWTQQMSVLYEQCCLQYQLRRQLEDVRRQLHNAVGLSDEDFIREAIDAELYGSLLESCDEVCIGSGERKVLENRVDTLLKARMKVYHPSGDIRVLVVPQRQPFPEVQKQLVELFEDETNAVGGATAYRMSYVDGDGDRVIMKCEADWRECLRQKRESALMSYSLRATTTTKASAGEALISIFLELNVSAVNNNNNNTPGGEGRLMGARRASTGNMLTGLARTPSMTHNTTNLAQSTAQRTPPHAPPPSSQQQTPQRTQWGAPRAEKPLIFAR